MDHCKTPVVTKKVVSALSTDSLRRQPETIEIRYW